jgi:glycosyl transferase family 25
MDISTIAYTNARIGIKEQPVVPNVLFISSDYLDQICKFYVNLFSLPITQFVSRIDPYSHAYSKSTIHYSDMMFLQQAIDELALDFAILPEDGESILFNANIRSYDIDISGTHLFKKGTTSHLANVHFQGDMKWKAEYYLNKLNQYSNLFEFVDKIVYINLADRTDRKERLLADLHPIVPRDKIVRFDAIRHNPTTVGFTMSHIAVLELAIKNKWRNVLILEDDAILNKPEKLSQGYTNLEKIIGGHWDAICLGLLNPKYDIDTMRITQSLSTVAYMVNSHYYEVLLNHFKAALNGLVKTNEWSTYALDQWWWQLMKRDNWFGTAPSVFIQNNTISSICGEMYRCMDHYI